MYHHYRKDARQFAIHEWSHSRQAQITRHGIIGRLLPVKHGGGLMTLDIRAFIFDLDGVIADTAEYHYQSWQQLADEEGLPFNRQDNEALLGVSRRESLRRLLKGKAIDETTAQAWMERKNQYFSVFLNQMTPDNLLPGIRRFLDEALASGFKLGVASSSRNARAVLKQLQIYDRFEAVADALTVVNNKPAPDLFIWAAGYLRVSPPNAIVIEDSESGVEAALAGGFRVIGIGHANVEKAHLLLPDTAALQLETVLRQLNLQASRTGK
jgi:beta-phosphoglucomutase